MKKTLALNELLRAIDDFDINLAFFNQGFKNTVDSLNSKYQEIISKYTDKQSVSSNFIEYLRMFITFGNVLIDFETYRQDISLLYLDAKAHYTDICLNSPENILLRNKLVLFERVLKNTEELTFNIYSKLCNDFDYKMIPFVRALIDGSAISVVLNKSITDEKDCDDLMKFYQPYIKSYESKFEFSLDEARKTSLCFLKSIRNRTGEHVSDKNNFKF